VIGGNPFLQQGADPAKIALIKAASDAFGPGGSSWDARSIDREDIRLRPLKARTALGGPRRPPAARRATSHR